MEIIDIILIISITLNIYFVWRVAYMKATLKTIQQMMSIVGDQLGDLAKEIRKVEK